MLVELEPGKTKQRIDIEPVAVDAARAAAMLSISTSMFHRLLSSGRLGFKKIRLANKCVRYSTEEIREYSRAGCPSREQWLRMEET